MPFDANEESFEEVTIFGKPALFTPIRIDRDTVPQGYFAYDVRQEDDGTGDAVEIAPFIRVNHLGTLIVRDEIDLSAAGHLIINDEDLNYDTGNCERLRDYMAKYPSS